MKVAIDIDGTIYDTEKYFRVQAELFDIDVLQKNSLINRGALWANNRDSWNEDENKEFMGTLQDITRKSNLIPGSKEVINKFQNMGIETIVVTARGSVGFDNFEEMMKDIEDKLDHDNLHFDKIFWKNLDKVDTCLRENVDFLIDDSPEVCKRTSSAGVNTIYLRDAGIEKIEPNEHLFEAANWGEIYRIVSNAKTSIN